MYLLAGRCYLLYTAATAASISYRFSVSSSSSSSFPPCVCLHLVHAARDSFVVGKRIRPKRVNKIQTTWRPGNVLSWRRCRRGGGTSLSKQKKNKATGRDRVLVGNYNSMPVLVVSACFINEWEMNPSTPLLKNRGCKYSNPISPQLIGESRRMILKSAHLIQHYNNAHLRLVWVVARVILDRI